MNKVAVIIPNYNGIKYIKDCMDSLMIQSMTEFDIIVVDNASADDSMELVEREYPNVITKRLDKNYGFCRAVNVGIQMSTAEYVILLNNDTKAHEDMVLELYNAISKYDDTFAVAAKMVQMYSPDKIDAAGDLYCALGWAYSIGKDKPVDMYNKESVVFSACAGAAIYRKAVFEQIGYFDEAHTSYLEDVDVCYRARIEGYKNRYTNKAIVYHAGSGTSGSRHNAFKVGLASRNSVYVIYKNMPTWQIVLNFPFLLAGFGVKALFFIKKGFGKEYLQGMKNGFRMCSDGKKYSKTSKHLKNYLVIQLELWINMFRRIFG